VQNFLEYYKIKGHVFGECMSSPNTDLMYVNIPKNASSWTKPNLKDWGWEFYNYHADNLYDKHALVVLRDPVDRWLSGIAEYMYLYHRNIDVAHLSKPFFDLVFEKVSFDDHTDLQILFIEGLKNCTFLLCNENYKLNFSNFLKDNGFNNSYQNYENQHVTAFDSGRKKFKDIFKLAMDNNKSYQQKIKWHFQKDYELINSVKFYGD
jgi:hypothetical protein